MCENIVSNKTCRSVVIIHEWAIVYGENNNNVSSCMHQYQCVYLCNLQCFWTTDVGIGIL